MLRRTAYAPRKPIFGCTENKCIAPLTGRAFVDVHHRSSGAVVVSWTTINQCVSERDACPKQTDANVIGSRSDSRRHGINGSSVQIDVPNELCVRGPQRRETGLEARAYGRFDIGARLEIYGSYRRIETSPSRFFSEVIDECRSQYPEEPTIESIPLAERDRVSYDACVRVLHDVIRIRSTRNRASGIRQEASVRLKGDCRDVCVTFVVVSAVRDQRR